MISHQVGQQFCWGSVREIYGLEDIANNRRLLNIVTDNFIEKIFVWTF